MQQKVEHILPQLNSSHYTQQQFNVMGISTYYHFYASKHCVGRTAEVLNLIFSADFLIPVNTDLPVFKDDRCIPEDESDISSVVVNLRAIQRPFQFREQAVLRFAANAEFRSL